jgi:hypothetical protein
MTEYLIYILTFLYGLGGIITFIGYFPTIKDLWNKKASANIQTYIIWTITMFIASLYGIFVLKDATFILVVNLQLLACAIILILGIRLKYKSK